MYRGRPPSLIKRQPRFYLRLTTSHMQLTPPHPQTHDEMNTFRPVTIDEVQEAYERLVDKGRAKIRVPVGYRGMAGSDDPSVVSLLPVGRDGMTTVQVERSPEAKMRFFAEVVRLFNEDDRVSGLPKFRLKRFSLQERKEKRGNQEKIRRTVLLCLRDQVAMRVLLDRVTRANIVHGNWNDVFGQVAGIHQDLQGRSAMPVIIKTDITEFHPSVDRSILIDLLRTRTGSCFDGRTLGMLAYAIDGHPMADEIPGLPLGLSVSVILAEFYAQQMSLPTLIPGVSVYRYADDIMLIADAGTDPAMMLQCLDDRLAAFRLRRNTFKTKVVSNGVFDYLGVDFNGTRVSVDEARVRRWSTAVWAEVGKDIESHRVLSALQPGVQAPDRQALIRGAFREYKRGGRSSYWKFVQRVRALNPPVDCATAVLNDDV